MAYKMITTFIDNSTGEEYEFLGTNITFSEKALISLEQEHDRDLDAYVERLRSEGFFEEEWTDFYAETDVEDEDEDEDDAENENAQPLNTEEKVKAKATTIANKENASTSLVASKTDVAIAVAVVTQNGNELQPKYRMRSAFSIDPSPNARRSPLQHLRIANSRSLQWVTRAVN